MKNIIDILTILCCIVLLGSCSKVDDGSAANEAVTIQLDIPSTIDTKAGTDQGTTEENYIGVTQVVFFAPTSDKTGVVERIITFNAATSNTDGQAVWDAGTKKLLVSGIDASKLKNVYVVANATTANGYDTNAIKVGTTTEKYLFDVITKPTTLPSQPTTTNGMLMSYMVSNYDFSTNYTLTVPLIRQLVKINLTVKIDQTFAGDFPATSFDATELKDNTFLNIYNVPNQSFVYSTTPATIPTTSTLSDLKNVKGITKSGNNTTAEWRLTIYTYENPTSGKSAENKSASTWFILNLPYKNNGSQAFIKNYYKFYINDQSDTNNPHKTLRNHTYNLTATVNGFGSPTPEDGQEVEVTTNVLDWNTVDINESVGKNKSSTNNYFNSTAYLMPQTSR